MRRRTRAEVEAENRNVVLVTVAAVVLLFSVFFLSPGMFIVTFAVRPFVHLDRAQMWIFSAVASAATYGGIHVGLGPDRKASSYYLASCGLAVSAFIVAKFGLHAEWADRMFDAFTQGGGS